MAKKEHIEFTPEVLKKVEKWAWTLCAGDIAANLGISKTAFWQYCRDNPELKKHYSRGRSESVETLENVLVEKAKKGCVQSAKFLLTRGKKSSVIVSKWKPST